MEVKESYYGKESEVKRIKSDVEMYDKRCFMRNCNLMVKVLNEYFD